MGLDAAVHEDDEALWAAQREAQRSDDAIVLRVAGLPSALETVVGVAERAGASLVARAGIGTFWLRLPDAAALAEADRELPPFPRAVIDSPTPVRLDQPRDDALARLEERVKARFDPAGALP